MDISQSENKESYESMSSSSPQSIHDMMSSLKIGEELVEPAQPHEALVLILSYLNLFELLRMSQVCKSLRDAIDSDILLWLDIVVEPPLNLRINDDNLLKFTSKAQGRLRSLVLPSCVRITDDGLLRVIQNNPHINKLYIPSCSQLTPDGVVRAVKILAKHNNKLFLRLENIYNITKEHLQIIYSCLKLNPEEQNRQKSKLYLGYGHFQVQNDLDPIDIEVCPKCKDVRLVFECPRESCRSKNKRPLAACKGCLLCIPRCEGCGGCVDLDDETGETVCLDLVCLECWLQLRKCNLCNKPYCNRHVDKIEWSRPDSYGFVCEVCSTETES